MLIRPKLFLTFSALCISPLLILSLISFRSGLKDTDRFLRAALQDELSDVVRHYQSLVDECGNELLTLTRGPLPNYIRTARTPEAVALVDPSRGSSTSGPASEAAFAVRKAITELPHGGLYYAQLACFDSDKHLMFLAQPVDYSSPTFRTKDFLPGVVAAADPRVQWAKNDSPRYSIISQPTLGTLQRSNIPIYLTADTSPGSPRGVLVTDIRLDRLFETAARGSDVPAGPPRAVIVLTSSGEIVYHPNEAIRHRLIDGALPRFAHVAAAMMSGEGEGTGEYRSAEGETWIAAFQTVFPGLSLAVARNYSVASQASWRAGWLEIGLSILLGFAAATLLASYFQRQTWHIERVTESVAAIAGGNLDQRVEARSSDDMRLLADSINLMTEQLRERIAREAEARQFQSFIRLSAVLTHDLKNAIEALSLIVGNMERHFDNPEFRADAMKALTGATDKLRALVARLSKPVATLSGEFRMPRPTDLVPLLRRVLAQTAEPVREQHQIKITLPESLVALVNGERIEKVIENLILNALEAMSGKSGTLTVEAGAAGGSKVFFSVTDTGVGMSPEFIEERLFRPFSTTKSTGVGLGLYTCREVVRANGGTIDVQSTEGSGTTFRVVLASAENKKPEQ